MLPDTCMRCVVPFIVDSSLHFSAFMGASAEITQEAPSVGEKQNTPCEAIFELMHEAGERACGE